MKYLLVFMLAMLGTSTSYGDGLKIKVSGLVCNLCAQGITKKFTSEEAVKEVSVDMDKMEVYLDFKANETIPKAKIESLIKDAGYTVESFLPEGK